MGKLWTITKREYLERVRTKWFIIATIFGPIFFGAIIIVPALMAKKSKSSQDYSNTRILDATTTGLGNRIAQSINRGRTAGGAVPHVVLVKPGDLTQAESTATHDVMNKEISGYL